MKSQWDRQSRAEPFVLCGVGHTGWLLFLHLDSRIYYIPGQDPQGWSHPVKMAGSWGHHTLSTVHMRCPGALLLLPTAGRAGPWVPSTWLHP